MCPGLQASSLRRNRYCLKEKLTPREKITPLDDKSLPLGKKLNNSLLSNVSRPASQLMEEEQVLREIDTPWIKIKTPAEKK